MDLVKVKWDLIYSSVLGSRVPFSDLGWDDSSSDVEVWSDDKDIASFQGSAMEAGVSCSFVPLKFVLECFWFML